MADERPDDDPEFRALRTLSAGLGRDIRRTQAAGGNTSLKRGGRMWIKASGTWLADAGDRDIFVPVDHVALRAAVGSGDLRAGDATAFVAADLSPTGLRPSVETPVHAVLRFPVVLHIHCVATVALAVRTDAAALVAERLAEVSDVRWAVLPYIHPGLPLAQAIAALPEGTDTIVLGNHGLVVAGETVAEAGARLGRVVAAFEALRRSAPSADIAGLARDAAGSPYRLPADPAAHDVATDQASLAIARQGTLYPDHVVFLGSGITVPDDGAAPAAIAAAAAAEGRSPPPILALPGRGILLHRDVKRGADDLARGLAEVAARIPAGARVVTLTAAEEAALVNWDAEHYRLAMAMGR